MATQIGSVTELGRLVRAERKRQGIDQVTAAELCGVSPRWFGELERGKETLRLGLVLRVARRLGLELWVAPRGELRADG